MVPLIKERINELKLDNNLLTRLDVNVNIKKLSVKNNKVRDIENLPSSIENLNLSNNRIIKTANIVIPNILFLDFSKNFISDTNLNFLKIMSRLKYLNLSFNNLKSSLIYEIIANLSNLKVIYFFKNIYKLLTI